MNATVETNANSLNQINAQQTRKEQKDLDAEMRKRISTRRRRRIRAKIYTVLLWTVVTFLACWAAYLQWPRFVEYALPAYDKYGQDYRPCIFKVGERTVTGQRSYSYRYMNLFGYKIFMTPDAEVQQETRLDIAFNGITIVGNIKAGSAWESKKLQIEDGEKYKQLLPYADTYTFFMDGGKNVATVSYSDICK